MSSKPPAKSVKKLVASPPLSPRVVAPQQSPKVPQQPKDSHPAELKSPRQVPEVKPQSPLNEDDCDDDMTAEEKERWSSVEAWIKQANENFLLLQSTSR